MRRCCPSWSAGCVRAGVGLGRAAGASRGVSMPDQWCCRQHIGAVRRAGAAVRPALWALAGGQAAFVTSAGAAVLPQLLCTCRCLAVVAVRLTRCLRTSYFPAARPSMHVRQRQRQPARTALVALGHGRQRRRRLTTNLC